MSNIELGQNIETTPLNPAPNAPPPSYTSIAGIGKNAGTTFFVISTLIAAIIPAVKLGIGIYYDGQCPIDQRISTYMIVAGAVGLVLAALALLLALTFLCFLTDSTALSILASCGIALNLILSVVISIFLFIWFIIGCVWVFSVTNRVQFKDPHDVNYCDPVLYDAAFALLIITIVWGAIQCCASCCRAFCN